MLMQT
jgi:hypothetical protein